MMPSQQVFPPLATQALCAVHEEQWDDAINAADRILTPEFEEKSFNHPEGNPTAIAHAVRALVLLQREDMENGLLEAQKAQRWTDIVFWAFALLPQSICKNRKLTMPLQPTKAVCRFVRVSRFSHCLDLMWISKNFLYLLE